MPRCLVTARSSSPVSDGGRGLKHYHVIVWLGGGLFARQRWRAWIETTQNSAEQASQKVRPSAMAGVD